MSSRTREELPEKLGRVNIRAPQRSPLNNNCSKYSKSQVVGRGTRVFVTDTGIAPTLEFCILCCFSVHLLDLFHISYTAVLSE